jgi:hypothetical protein
MTTAEQNIKKIILILISIGGSLFLLIVIPILIYAFLGTPNSEKARSLIRSTSRYYPPISTKSLYSKNYWESIDGREPRSMCFVFKYSEKDFTAFQNHDFSQKNQEKSSYPYSRVPVDKGCNKFRSSLETKDLALFKKHFEYFSRSRGATIFVNDNDRILMFEIYLFD